MRLKSMTILILPCCFVALAVAPVNAQGIDEAAKTLARQIKHILAENKLHASAAVGRFDSQFGPSATLGIQQRLQVELSKLDVGTTSEDVEVTGKVHRNEFLMSISGYVTILATSRRISIADARAVDLDTSVPVIDEQAELTQQETQQLRGAGKLAGDQKVAAVVTETEDLVAVSGPTYELDVANTSKTERNQALKDEILYGIEEPEVCIRGSVVSAFDGADFGIELLTKDGRGQFTGHPNITALKDGNAFVNLKLHDEVAIRVINNADYDVGVKILIDGLNSFSFSTVPSYREVGLYFIERLGGRPSEHFAYPITGWHIDNRSVHAFNVTTLPNSAARELKQEFSGKVGVITVQFFPSWKSGEEPPATELAASRGAVGRGLAFGKGDIKAQDFVEVRRLFGKTVAAAISVRYQHP